MPMYVYKCDACGATFERKQSITEEALTDCPECDGRVRRVIQPVGIVFKGSGFYVTDHRSHSATTEPSGSSSPSSSESSASEVAKPDPAPAKTESKPESKPDGKAEAKPAASSK